MADSIEPGSEPSYQLCKLIYLYHPLGAKMAEAPINMAQRQQRVIAIQEAPSEVAEAYTKQWAADAYDTSIHNAARIPRIYGIGALTLGAENPDGTAMPTNVPIEMTEIWQKRIFFNVMDPLNTSGSLVLNQIPNAPDFNKPKGVTVQGQSYHPSRFVVMLNEEPIYISYTSSAFGFVGRSVYQRALFPLKTFIRFMIADDMIATKLALLVAKRKSPGSVVDQVMQNVGAAVRWLLKMAQSGNVLQIDIDEEIETLNMQNVDGAGTYARTNCIKNVATAGDMPAVLLENETLVSGFGEGTEDAKNIAGYVDRIRIWMAPLYAFCDNVCQYRAWNPKFYETIQAKYPDQYGAVSYDEAFLKWRAAFSATWPEVMKEPESELAAVDKIKFEAVIAAAEVLLPLLDPKNQATVMEWITDCLADNKRLFPHSLELDFEELQSHLEEQKQQADEMAQSAMQAPEGEEGGAQEPDGLSKKFGKFDSVTPLRRLTRFRSAVDDYQATARRRQERQAARTREAIV
jgi:hypothetical protein